MYNILSFKFRKTLMCIFRLIPINKSTLITAQHDLGQFSGLLMQNIHESYHQFLSIIALILYD